MHQTEEWQQSVISGFGILRIPLETCQCCNSSDTSPRFDTQRQSLSQSPRRRQSLPADVCRQRICSFLVRFSFTQTISRNPQNDAKSALLLLYVAHSFQGAAKMCGWYEIIEVMTISISYVNSHFFFVTLNPKR